MVLLVLSSSVHAAIPALYDNAAPFDTAAVAAEAQGSGPGDITGLVTPHHMVAADLIARAFQLVKGQPVELVVILTPDHFRRSAKPFATTHMDFETVYGQVSTRQDVVARLLEASDLVEQSDLFEQEHGIAAVLPLLHRALPRAEIVPVAVSLSSRRPDWDRLFAMLAPLLGPRTLVVQSTDFSHYLTFPAAVRRDRETLAAMATGDLNAIAALRQPDHVDSTGAAYLQLRLQREVFDAGPVVLFNRNMQHYERAPVRSTTSYVVAAFSQGWGKRVSPDMPGSQRLCFAGDTFFGRSLAARLLDEPAAARLRTVLDELLGRCRLVVNLEGVTADPLPSGLPPLRLGMPQPLALRWLRSLNVVAAGLANNHARDLGPAAYAGMVRALRAYGIKAVGNGEVVDLGPLRIMALTDLDNSARPSNGLLDRQRLRRRTAAVTRPPLFVLMHWGVEFEDAPGAREEALSADLVNSGAAAIVGAHPHVAAPGIGLVPGSWTPRAYSLRNFIFDQGSELASGAVLEVRLFEQGTFALLLVPVPNSSAVLAGAAAGQRALAVTANGRGRK